MVEGDATIQPPRRQPSAESAALFENDRPKAASLQGIGARDPRDSRADYGHARLRCVGGGFQGAYRFDVKLRINRILD